MSESINTSGKFYLAHFGKYSMSIYTDIFLVGIPFEYREIINSSIPMDLA